LRLEVRELNYLKKEPSEPLEDKSRKDDMMECIEI
jgi:hypothetical protein